MNLISKVIDWLEGDDRPYHKIRVLFILKKRHGYHDDTRSEFVTGMYNSAKFVSDMLEQSGIRSRLEVVVDNNSIDKVVTNFKPTHVIIEGIWVVPEKFDVLSKLHPNVRWIVRCHSELPFLAQEGNAIAWIFQYLNRGISVSGNSPRVNNALRLLATDLVGHKINRLIPLLPNYYPLIHSHALRHRDQAKTILDVGCFGAVRPLKNQLLQATAAIIFARSQKLKLRFHINGGRVEQNGNSHLKNLRALFATADDIELVEHEWLSHPQFLGLMRKMDISMQVSLSETFNVVSADATAMGVPTVVSQEVVWAAPLGFADSGSVEDTVRALERVWCNQHHVAFQNFENLKEYSRSSKDLWLNYLERH